MTDRRHANSGKCGSKVLRAEGGYAVMESMRWRTPPGLVAAVARHLKIGGFDMDACAEAGARHADTWFSAEHSCLVNPWPSMVRSVWMNPPFGSKGIPKKKLRESGFDPASYAAFPGVSAFVERAADWAEEPGRVAAVCLPASMDAGRFPHLRRADEVILVGRVPFIDVQGVPQTSPPGAHMILIFRGRALQTTLTIGLDYDKGTP